MEQLMQLGATIHLTFYVIDMVREIYIFLLRDKLMK